MEYFDPYLTLADEVEAKFTPAAWKCGDSGCGRCAEIRRTDTYAIAQAATVQRIAAWIRTVKALDVPNA